MAMDFKSLISNNPFKAFYGLLIVFGIVIASLVAALWNRYANIDVDNATHQLKAFNNYILALPPTDTTAINNISTTLLVDKNNTIDKVFFSIYDIYGTRLYTNATSGRNANILSFKKINNDFIADTASYKNTSEIKQDAVLEEESIISTSFSGKEKRYIISQCTVKNNASIKGFISTMQHKLTLIGLITLIAALCLLMLFRHICNTQRLRRYILQLSNEEEMRKYNLKPITDNGTLENLSGDLYTLYKSQIDIIKQHDRERELAILEEKERLNSKRILANNLKHEIKTPIGIIIGYLDTLINHPDIDRKTMFSFIKKCLSNAQRLQNMVVNIAVINRIDDGSNNIALDEVNIYNLATLVREDLKFTLNESNMTFRIEIEPNTFVKSNETLLYNVLSNLVKNSCFYSKGTCITLTTIDDTSPDFIKFSFYDNGIGVPSEAIPRLFERFYRFEKDKDKKGGTGLGLPIVKESITLSGGTVTVDNRIDGGLEFQFTLPTSD